MTTNPSSVSNDAPPTNIIWLITGANKGLGLAMTQHLLSKPNTTVIATTRSPSPILSALKPTSPTSNLILTTLDVTSPPEVCTALATALLTHHNIQHIDNLLANAGSSPAFQPLTTTPPTDILSALSTNTLGTLKLFQAFHSHLQKSSNPKFIVVSSILGSISAMDMEPNGAYGVSKAAVNFLVRKLHFENEGLVVLALHPGWVGTEMGRAFAGALGIEGESEGGFKFPVTAEESAKGMIGQIEACGREGSGRFVDYKGEVVPW